MSRKIKSPIFLLLGGNKLNQGIQNKFQKLGYRVFVIDWNETPFLVGDKHYRIDVKQPYSILDALRKDDYWDSVEFAYSSIDLAVPSVAMLNREIGLKTISDQGLLYSSSKAMMTNRWNQLGLLNRFSMNYKEFSDEIVYKNQEVKLIIKPDNSASSRGITIIEKNSDINTIRNAFFKAKQEASDNIVVVEEFVEGTEYTVELIGDSYGNVSVYAISRKTHTMNTNNNKIAIKLHYNSEDDSLQKDIASFGIQCYKALWFSSSLGHLEIIRKQDGTFTPIEIGARSSGFIASDLVDIVSGRSFLEELIKVQKGEMITEGLHNQTDMSSMYFFYDFPDGTVVKKECCLMDFCNNLITSRYHDRSNIKLGQKFSLIDNDNARLGYEILEGKKSIMTEQFIINAEHKMLHRMIGE